MRFIAEKNYKDKEKPSKQEIPNPREESQRKEMRLLMNANGCKRRIGRYVLVQMERLVMLEFRGL